MPTSPTLSFPSLFPGFVVRLQQEGDLVEIDCSGVLEAADAAEKLAPALLELHGQLLAAKPRMVRLNFNRLSYMNSGAIKAFAAWFIKAENAGKPPYLIEAHHDPGSTWQGWSFGVLQRIAPNAIKLVPPRRA